MSKLHDGDFIGKLSSINLKFYKANNYGIVGKNNL